VQKPLVYEDEYYGEPGLSSVRYESDFAMYKHKIDIIVNGTAHAPRDKAVRAIDVNLQIAEINKTIRVFGDRVWKKSLFRGYHSSEPKPFNSMPLLYERAFGGADTSHKDKKKHKYETANLVGVGFHYRNHKGIQNSLLPNMEHPNKLIRKPFDKVPPVGFGYISRNWDPRSKYAGTYDNAWRQNRYPFLPLDFGDQYFQGAPIDQLCSNLQGGESVKLINFTPQSHLEFILPKISLPVKLIYLSDQKDLISLLDTVLIEPDEMCCQLTYRSTTRVTGKLTDLHEVWVGAPSKAREQALKTGKNYINWFKINE
jgi:hypothetical protein